MIFLNGHVHRRRRYCSRCAFRRTYFRSQEPPLKQKDFFFLSHERRMPDKVTPECGHARSVVAALRKLTLNYNVCVCIKQMNGEFSKADFHT